MKTLLHAVLVVTLAATLSGCTSSGGVIKRDPPPAQSDTPPAKN